MSAVDAGIVHVHSAYSHDGKDPLPTLHAACVARGIRFVALADHAEDFTPEIFARFVEECASVSDARCTLIPGLEFRFAGRKGLHLLAFGLREFITPESPAEFIAQAVPRCALTVAAHPVLYGHRIPAEVLDGIGAIEVWNAAYNTRFLPDPAAIRALHAVRTRRPEVVGLAGLDQHDSRNDRETRVLVRAGAMDPLAELRAGRFTNRGRTLGFDARASFPGWRMAALRAARGAFDVVEGVQERIARSLANRRARSGAAR